MKRGREVAGRGQLVTVKETWPKRGPGEPPLRAAVAAADDSEDADAVEYQAFIEWQHKEDQLMGTVGTVHTREV